MYNISRLADFYPVMNASRFAYALVVALALIQPVIRTAPILERIHKAAVFPFSATQSADVRSAVFTFNKTLPRLNFTVDGKPFYSNKMNYSDDELAKLRLESIQYYSSEFGIESADVNPNIEFQLLSTDPVADTRAFILQPHNSGFQGLKVYDGAFYAFVMNPNGIDLGGNFTGVHVPFGTMFNYGFWYIETVDEAGDILKPLILKFKASAPGYVDLSEEGLSVSAQVGVESTSGDAGSSLFVTEYTLKPPQSYQGVYTNIIRF